MSRNELIIKISEKFKVQELVCEHCYKKFGESSWQFLSTELLSTLYTLRFVIFNKPITINTWHNGGGFSQRGLRCNMCQLVKSKGDIYISAHLLGKAIDFNVQGCDTEDVYKAIRDNISLFEYPIRMEITGGNWNHIDVYQPYRSEANLIEFKG